MISESQATEKTTRRGFLTTSLAAGGAVAAGGVAKAAGEPAITEVQSWARELGKGVDEGGYGLPSPYEAGVQRRNVPWLTPDAASSINFTPLHQLDGTITPNGLCFERHHSGVAAVDPAKYRLMINGLVERELVFTLADLKRFPRVNRTYFLECSANTGLEWRAPRLDGCQYTHGMIHNLMYTGVLLRDVLDAAGVQTAGKWLLAEGGDAALMSRSIPMEKALDDCMIAFAMNGEALRAEQGYPVRLVVPGWEGNMWVKWLRRLEVGDAPWHQREETSKYTDLLADGTARRFSWEMDAKSVITSPSPQTPIEHGPGPAVLSGLAWSGRGTVDRIDVTLDGGVNWHEARIDGPKLTKSLQRFYFDFEWDGAPLLLQSRAIDSTGYVQPTKDALRAIRGNNFFYHNNGIQTWAVNADGRVENVEVS